MRFFLSCCASILMFLFVNIATHAGQSGIVDTAVLCKVVASDYHDEIIEKIENECEIYRQIKYDPFLYSADELYKSAHTGVIISKKIADKGVYLVDTSRGYTLFINEKLPTVCMAPLLPDSSKYHHGDRIKLAYIKYKSVRFLFQNTPQRFFYFCDVLEAKTDTSKKR